MLIKIPFELRLYRYKQRWYWSYPHSVHSSFLGHSNHWQLYEHAATKRKRKRRSLPILYKFHFPALKNISHLRKIPTNVHWRFFLPILLFTNIFPSLLRLSTGCHTRIPHNIQTTAQSVKFKPPNVTVNILRAPCGHKMSNYVIVKNR